MKENYIGIVEIDEDIMYLTHDDDFIYSNGMTNAGYYRLGQFDMDDCLSLDENIQEAVEKLQEVTE